MLLVAASSPSGFDPRPHAEGDLTSRFASGLILVFDPRPHAEGDPPPPRSPPRGHSFDPRPHAEGDPTPPAGPPHCQSFDPRPHAEGDQPDACRERTEHVSIHALMRRATMDSRFGS